MNATAVIIAYSVMLLATNYTHALPYLLTLIISSLMGLIAGALVQRIQVDNVISNSRTKISNKAIKEHSITTYRNINTQIVTTFSKFIDSKDSYTNNHSIRVGNYAYFLGKKLHFSSFDLDILYYSALLHDVGKIAIPDSILSKDCKLTDEEFDIIKQHPLKGKEMLSTFTSIPGLTVGVEFHHERIDGKGYPHGIKGDEIPLNAQIIAVADTWDALTTDRIYRKTMPRQKASQIMKDISGTQLCKKLVNLFLEAPFINSAEIPLAKIEGMRISSLAESIIINS